MRNAHAHLAELLHNFWLSQALFTATRLGLPDLVKDGPRSVTELADATKAHPRSLYRLLRALAASGVFSESTESGWADALFGPTAYTRALESDAPGSLASDAIYSGEVAYPAWGALFENVLTGRGALEHHFGMGLFEYLESHPKVLSNFNRLVADVSVMTNRALAEVDFSSARKIVDLGGGHSGLLAAILDRVPDATGVLFDLPHIIEKMNETVPNTDPRIRREGGSILATIPAGDTYIMKLVLHGFSNEDARSILQNIHRASGGKARVILVDAVVSDSPGPGGAKMWDLNTMVNGGSERTQREFVDLFGAAGFELRSVRPVPHSHVSVIEATAR